MFLPLARGGIFEDASGRERAFSNVTPGARYFWVSGKSAEIRDRALAFHPLAAVDQREGERGSIVYLGRMGGVAIYARAAASPATNFATLRAVGADIPGPHATCFVRAMALLYWHRESQFCARCGGQTVAQNGGWERHCLSCTKVEYPRTDPAVIVLVTNFEDEVLLAHNVSWRHPYVSVLAGYVEAGESPEQTAVREVKEEVGLDITGLKYWGSQAWPYPRSLMLGFTATTAQSAADLRLQKSEIGWAKFYSRAALAPAAATGELVLPGNAAIARYMLMDWYGKELPPSPKQWI
ncbi:MAG: NAD(+) diphosphatase [Actinomycetaceae bacterium]|nr:NAD(+) diphosphatase [Actinomycetaceae bacterium]